MTIAKHTKWLGLLLLICLNSTLLYGQEQVIKAGVAPGLSNGFYARLIHYIGDNLGMQVDIVEVPLQRRLLMLQQGQLDLAVGLLKNPNREILFNFIEPEYAVRKQEERLYLLKDNFTSFDNGTKLAGKTIATLRGSNLYKSFFEIKQEQLFETISLEQSLDLLVKKRVDYVLYAPKSMAKKLTDMSLQDEVYQSPIMPEKVIEKKIYMAIAKQSFLNQHLPELQQVASTLLCGEYDKLSELHYDLQ